LPTTLYGIDDLVVAIRALGDAPRPPDIIAALRHVPVDERALAPFFTWTPRRYTRNLIARSAAFELIALCWDAGATSAIHDHADSACAFVVHAGAIACENFRVERPARRGDRCALRSAGTRTIRRGELDVRSGPSVHRVGAEGGHAVTLHVYAKPIDACLNFGEDGSVREVAACYDSVRPSRS
jgi:cysteine dioxygenase